MDPLKEKKNCPHFGRCDLLMSDIFHHSSISLSISIYLSLSLCPQSRWDLIFILIYLRSGRLRLQSRRDPRISDLYHQPGGRAAPRAHPKLPDLVSKVWKLGLGLIRLDRIAGFLLRRILSTKYLSLFFSLSPTKYLALFSNFVYKCFAAQCTTN